jgi:molybdopterin converting factor small subunit
MRITVRLGEPFWRRVGAKQVEVDLPTGATVGDLVTHLSEQYPALREALQDSDLPPTVFLEDEIAEAQTPLSEGARPVLVWAMAGGSR